MRRLATFSARNSGLRPPYRRARCPAGSAGPRRSGDMTCPSTVTLAWRHALQQGTHAEYAGIGCAGSIDGASGHERYGSSTAARTSFIVCWAIARARVWRRRSERPSPSRAWRRVSARSGAERLQVLVEILGVQRLALHAADSRAAAFHVDHVDISLRREDLVHRVHVADIRIARVGALARAPGRSPSPGRASLVSSGVGSQLDVVVEALAHLLFAVDARAPWGPRWS